MMKLRLKKIKINSRYTNHLIIVVKQACQCCNYKLGRCFCAIYRTITNCIYIVIVSSDDVHFFDAPNVKVALSKIFGKYKNNCAYYGN